MAVSDRELIDFVYAEARMLDELRFEDWLTCTPRTAITGCRWPTARPTPSCTPR